MVAGPYISVIVTAYDRKKYLLGAVRSALDQTLPKDLYEVIVVKNFRDEAIDRQLEKWGVVNLYSDDVSQGGQVRDALGVARGDVISLLDDDDEFLPEKLERVYAAFRNGVDYYHNGRVVVNEAGKVLRKEGFSMLVKGDEEKARYAMQMITHSSFGNSSSISVRKHILEKIDLKRCELFIDGFMFTAALLSAHVMIDDPCPLTLFRVHSQHVGVDLGSFEATQTKALKSHSRLLSDTAYLARLSRGTPYERAIKFLFLDKKLAWLALPERPRLGDHGLNALSVSDLIEWLSFLPYLRHHLRYFTMRLLVPALPKAARRAFAKFTFDLGVRQALG
jgi:hypothetical protein